MDRRIDFFNVFLIATCIFLSLVLLLYVVTNLGGTLILYKVIDKSALVIGSVGFVVYYNGYSRIGIGLLSGNSALLIFSVVVLHSDYWRTVYFWVLIGLLAFCVYRQFAKRAGPGPEGR